MSAETIIWSLVSDLTTRVYRTAAPHNPALPFLLIQLLPSMHEHVLGCAAGCLNAFVQFDVISRDQDECISIIEAVRNRLNGYSDENVIYATITDEQDLSIPPDDASSQWLCRKVARYSIRINETLPSLSYEAIVESIFQNQGVASFYLSNAPFCEKSPTRCFFLLAGIQSKFRHRRSPSSQLFRYAPR